jgi:hypothetical protein
MLVCFNRYCCIAKRRGTAAGQRLGQATAATSAGAARLGDSEAIILYHLGVNGVQRFSSRARHARRRRMLASCANWSRPAHQPPVYWQVPEWVLAGGLGELFAAAQCANGARSANWARGLTPGATSPAPGALHPNTALRPASGGKGPGPQEPRGGGGNASAGPDVAGFGETLKPAHDHI